MPVPLPGASRLYLLLSVLSFVLATAGCERSAAPPAGTRDLPAEPAPAAALPKASTVADPVAPEAARRVIHTAELWLETDDPTGALQKVTALAETKGGFVLSSATSSSREDDGEEVVSVTIVVRVPAAVFDPTMDSLRRIGKRVSSEKVGGQDVSEEYVDLESRIRAQHALEEQYLTILKEAKAVHEILEVEQKLGEVRTEIERAEGRRRFLEDQTRLSTLSVHLARHLEAIEASGPGFGANLKKAAHDAVGVTVAVVNGCIRVSGVLAPIAALIGVPAWLLARVLVRRRRSRAATA